jgi:hypothetical protein
VGAEFADVADRADALAADLERTAGSLDGNRASLGSLADEVAGLGTELTELRAELGADVGAGAGGPDGDTGAEDPVDTPFTLSASTALALARVLVIAFVAWLAIPAVLVIAHGGRRWRRRGHVTVVHERAPRP